MIIRELLERVESELQSRTVTDLRIGISYTGVCLDGGEVGIAYTFREEVGHCCEIKDRAGELIGDSVLELARLALNPRPVDSAVGLATINAVLNRNLAGETGDILDFVTFDGAEKVGMVGNFCPLVSRLQDQVDLYVFERDLQQEGVYPDWAAEQYLPEMDAVILSGTTVVNRTLEHLLEKCSEAREKIILGPTTPLAPDILAAKGATVLGGTVIQKPGQALDIISQGGGTRTLQKTGEKVTLKLNQ